MNTRTTVRLTALILLLLCLLTACRSGGGDSETTPPPLPDYPLPEYKVIRPDSTSAAISDALGEYIAFVQAGYGFEPERGTDWLARGTSEEDAAAIREILIGATNRPESVSALASLEKNGYTVRRDGNKIVIVGASDSLTLEALNYFKTVTLKEIGEKGTMAEDYLYNGSRKPAYEAVYTEGGQRPCIILTRYPTEDTVIADVIATEDFGADNTGLIDSTDAIRAALNACRAAGGGCVYLPAGEYLVTGTITVPPGCILRGDWQDPDGVTAPEYGTVIIARPAPLPRSSEPSGRDALIRVENSAAVIGLTFYYPDQSPTDIKPYGFTVYAGLYDTMAMYNLTMINSYRGVGIDLDGEVHEFSQIENLRICALDEGMHMMCSPDVGTELSIRIDPGFWYAAADKYKCGDRDALLAHCRANTVGMVLGDLDDELFSDVVIRDAHTGIRFILSSLGRVSSFWGMFYDLEITGGVRGIEAQHVFNQAGVLIAGGRIEGSEYAISNTSPNGAGIKLCSTVTGGEVSGRVFREPDEMPDYRITPAVYGKPENRLFTVDVKASDGGASDITPALQAALDRAGEAGGGVVLLPAGVYAMDAPVTVPAGVELRGVTPIFTRDGRKTPDEVSGTVLLSYYREGALITLSEGAGVNGMRIWYPQNDPRAAITVLTEGGALTRDCIAVRGAGKGVYAVNMCIMAAYVGVDFTDCDSHVMDRVFGCCYSTFLRAGGQGGVIETCLSNLHFLPIDFPATPYTVTKFDPARCDTDSWNTLYSDNGSGTLIRDRILRSFCKFIVLDGAHGERVQSSFMYSAHNFMVATDSEAVLLNTSVDALYGENPMLHCINSRITAVNVLRIEGIPLVCENSEVDIINRCAFNHMSEPPYHSSEGTDDPSYVIAVGEKLMLNDCEKLKGTAGVRLVSDPALVAEGSGAWYHDAEPDNPVLVEYSFGRTNITDFIEDGYLHISVYIEDYDRYIGGGGEIELTSSGRCDVGEANWNIAQFVRKSGWNELFLPLNCAASTGDIDYRGVNYIRVYAHANACGVAFDNIYVCRRG